MRSSTGRMCSRYPSLSWHILGQLLLIYFLHTSPPLPSPPLPSPPPQVGDDDEVMYLVAPSANECSQWVAALQKGVSVSEVAALQKGLSVSGWQRCRKVCL